MLFFCQGDLNLESRDVDACIQRGESCGQPAADMFCQYLGFEGAAPSMFRTKTAEGPARSMTGVPGSLAKASPVTAALLLGPSLLCLTAYEACKPL